MKSQNPYRDIFAALQGLTFAEATEILEAVQRGIQEISARQTLTPEIVGGLELERPRQG